jgi:hypothetical protein
MSGDWSSGLLSKLIAFLADIEVTAVCIARSIPFDQTLIAVGSLLTLVTTLQITYSVSSGPATLNITPNTAPVSFMATPTGTVDLGRWIKFISLLVGIAIINGALFTAKVGIPGVPPHTSEAVAIAGAFFAVTAGTDIGQKATGT